MKNYLSELKKFLLTYRLKTSELDKLEARVDDLIIEELMKDCLLHRSQHITQIEKDYKLVKYKVHKDDYNHISEYLHLVQYSLPSNILVGTNYVTRVFEDEPEEECLVIFKVKGNNR